MIKTLNIKSSEWEKIDIQDRGSRHALEIVNNGEYPFYFYLGRNESEPPKTKGRIIKPGEISSVGMYG